MAQALWIGNIHFKDTTVPVKLTPAVREDRLQFHLLHKTDKVKLHQQMVCAFEKTPVPADEELKGFRVAERKYVLIGADDLKKAEPAGESRDITVHEFVKTDAIDPVFMEHTYYLEPKAPSKEYSALAAALKEMGRLGISTWTMKKRSYLGALGSDGKTLRLTVLRFAEDIVRAGSLGLVPPPLPDKELAIAGELIKKLTARWQPEKLHNVHQQELRALINKKGRGGKIAAVRPRPPKATESGELLKRLEESLKVAA